MTTLCQPPLLIQTLHSYLPLRMLHEMVLNTSLSQEKMYFYPRQTAIKQKQVLQYGALYIHIQEIETFPKLG